MMLLAYFKRHVKIIILAACFVGIFAAVFSLYELHVEAVAYAAVLCLAVGLVLFGVGYGRNMRKHRRLKALTGRISLGLDDLPEPAGVLEADYQELLGILYADKLRAEARAASEQQNTADYCTLWAHQIKTPIAAMGLLLQQDDAGKAAPELRAELFKIEQYVDMVLAYVRLGEGAGDLVLRACALDDVIRAAVRKYTSLFILKKLSLDFRPTGVTLVTDERWLGFIIEQAIANAIKYTRSGGVSIRAEAGELVIEDTGIGIRPEDLPRVFEKGFTGYNGRTGEKSTGIGLYLSARAARRTGHSLRLESVPGEGTRLLIGLGRSESIKE